MSTCSRPVGASKRIVAGTRRPKGVRCAATPTPPSSRSAQPSPSCSEHADATRGQRWAARAVAVALAAIETVRSPPLRATSTPHSRFRSPARFRGTWRHPTRYEPCIGTPYDLHPLLHAYASPRRARAAHRSPRPAVLSDVARTRAWGDAGDADDLAAAPASRRGPSIVTQRQGQCPDECATRRYSASGGAVGIEKGNDWLGRCRAQWTPRSGAPFRW
jgi:hypothetical protein